MQRSNEEIDKVSKKIYNDVMKEIHMGRMTSLDFLMRNCELLKNKKDLTREDHILLNKYKDHFGYTAPEILISYIKSICRYKALGFL